MQRARRELLEEREAREGLGREAKRRLQALEEQISVATVELAEVAELLLLLTHRPCTRLVRVLGLAVLGFLGLVFLAVVLQRLGDEEGEHYSRNVKE